MEPREWSFGRLRVCLHMAPFDDSELDAVLKTDNIPLGVSVTSTTESKIDNNVELTAREASSAKRIVYWPHVTIYDADRRQTLFTTVSQFLQDADEAGEDTLGISTLGPEIGMVPNWEIAEEIAKAIYLHSGRNGSVSSVNLITTSIGQFNSFILPMENIEMFII